MRSRIPGPVRAAAAAVVLLVLALIGCRTTGTTQGQSADSALADRLEKLPSLPADLAATLDPKTNATKMAGGPPEAVKPEGPLPVAPCCSIKQQKSLTVNVAVTKCGPLRDFIMAPISDLVMARETGGGGGGAPAGSAGRGINLQAYKYGPVSRTSPWDTTVCMTSTGPWDATFIEDRNCANYAPQDSLFVSAWGGLFAWYWNGGAPNHPTGITVASCRNVGTFRLPCGGPGSCECSSDPCPADQPCTCDPPW
jgi:hypothetical protein